MGTAAFTVLILTAATALYLHLNANLHSDDLYAGATGDAAEATTAETAASEAGHGAVTPSAAISSTTTS